jgi:predicted transcriptional regulator
MPIDRATFEEGEERYSIESEIISFLHDQSEEAFHVGEITKEVMNIGWSEANVKDPDVDDLIGCVLDVATVNSILDALVDDGAVKRRIVDEGQGERSYYAIP